MINPIETLMLYVSFFCGMTYFVRMAYDARNKDYYIGMLIVFSIFTALSSYLSHRYINKMMIDALEVGIQQIDEKYQEMPYMMPLPLALPGDEIWQK